MKCVLCSVAAQYTHHNLLSLLRLFSERTTKNRLGFLSLAEGAVGQTWQVFIVDMELLMARTSTFPFIPCVLYLRKLKKLSVKR
jgi:hypothetical protein